MYDISECIGNGDAETLRIILNEANRTVADQFGLTPENAPTNPAFCATEAVVGQMERGNRFFLLRDGSNAPSGCVAIEKNPRDGGVYYIERLAVLPERRHRGYGRNLLDRAVLEIRRAGARAAGIGIIDENRILKDWYLQYGFEVTGMKKFEHLPFTVCFLSLSL